MTNPTPTPNADIHAAEIQVPESLEGKPDCPICKGRGWYGGYPGIYRTCVCAGGHKPSEEPDFRSDATKLAALQSEIAQLRADLATATARIENFGRHLRVFVKAAEKAAFEIRHLYKQAGGEARSIDEENPKQCVAAAYHGLNDAAAGARFALVEKQGGSKDE